MLFEINKRDKYFTLKTKSMMFKERKIKQQKQQTKRGFSDGGAMLYGGVQFSFVLIGIILVAIAFFVLNSSVKSMVKEEYDRSIKGTVEILVGGLFQLQTSVESVSEILSLFNTVDREILAQKVRDLSSGIDAFDQVLWVYEESPGHWQYIKIHEDSKLSSIYKRYTIEVDPSFLSYIKKERIVFSSSTVVYTNLSFVSSVSDNERFMGIDAFPFALVKAVDRGDASAGILIGVGTVGSILNETWLDSNRSVASFAVRDMQSGYEIYDLDRKKLNGLDEMSGFTQTYEFKFANSLWEAKTEFVRNRQVAFIESIPLFVIVFGFMITAFGVLYIRSNSSRAIEVSEMYKALEEKNMQIEAEAVKRALLNKRLRQSEQENRAVIDAVSDIIFETDEEGIILFLNATWRKVTGFDSEPSVGLSLFKMLHPQDQEQQEKDFQLMVKGQKQAYRFFTRLRTSDGIFRAVELAVSMTRYDSEKNLRVVGTITDVEERRRAERALSEAEKKYRTIVENAAGGIYQLTPEGMYLSANPALARVLGYDNPEDILREIKDANESVYVDVRARQIFLMELEKREAIYSFETQVYKKDGTQIWINENVRIVKDENDNTLYYEGSIEDITVRKNSQIAMSKAKINSDLANRAKSEFLANMSHELRTPLNSIIGFSEMIKNEVFGPIGQKAYWEYAKDINESGEKLLNIINEILDISKIEAGERQLNEGVVELDKLVDASLLMLAKKIEVNKMTVSNTVQDAPHIVGEELAIKQVIMNLLSNAIKFTPSGGRITISTDVDAEGQLRLSVTDTGVGLDEMEMEKALSAFGQVDNEFSRSGSGTGLGLTLVDALIKLHGGELELFSQKGIGTTATIVFPADRVSLKT